MKTAIILAADGCEEIETLTPADYLRRAGIDVRMVGVTGCQITGAHNIVFTADITLSDFVAESEKGAPGAALPFDAIIIPGGMGGTKNIAQSEAACALICNAQKQNRFVCAICAAPVVVLSPLGLLKKRHFTCYPNMQNEFASFAGDSWQELTRGALWQESRVVKDGNLITSRGPGTAEEFSLAVIESLCGIESRAAVAEGIVAR